MQIDLLKTAATGETIAVKAGTVAPALAALFLGLFLFWGVGFSQITALHNAGHDTRHSNAFPCH